MPRIVPFGVLCALVAVVGALWLASDGSTRPVQPRSMSAHAPTTQASAVLLGQATLKPSSAQIAAGRATAFEFRSTRAGTATSIGLYLDRRTRAKRIVLGLYSSRNGVPHKSLSRTAPIAAHRGRWNIVRLEATRVTAGTAYWLAILGTGGRLSLREPRHSSCDTPQSLLATLVVLPRVWPKHFSTSRACLISAYVSGEPARGQSATGQPVSGQPTTQSSTTASPPPPPPPPTDCAGTAGSDTVSQTALDHCGFPSMDSTGPAAGTTLTSAAGFTATTAGAVYNGLQVTGGITIAADDVTIENSDITDDDQSNAAIIIQNGVTGTQILNDSIHGSDDSDNALAFGVSNTYGSTLNSVVIDHTNFYNGDRILMGYGTVTNSYCLGGASFGDEHDECVYTDGGQPGISLIHDTLLNANPYQTAAVFVDSPDGSGSDGLGTVDIEDSLLGGGGYCIYGGEGSAGTHHLGPESILDNRFAGLFFPSCGQFGATAYMPSGLVWSGNVWDANDQPVPAPPPGS